MYELIEGLHRALGIESTLKFVLIIGLVGFGLFSITAWIIDAAYKHSPEYLALHRPPAPSLSAPVRQPPVTKPETEHQKPSIAHSHESKVAPNAPQVGSITQGAGSIAQIGGSGNRAQINNYGIPPREFSQAQHDAIASVISASGEHTIAVRAPNSGDGEAQQYADKITKAIEDGGWKVNPRPKFLISDRHTIGIWILVEDSNNPAPCAVSLRDALKNAGIMANFVEVKDFYNGNEPCELAVGSQN